MIKNFVKCTMPGKVAEDDKAGLTVGRMATESKRPFRVLVGEYEREMSDCVAGGQKEIESKISDMLHKIKKDIHKLKVTRELTVTRKSISI